MVLAPRIFLQNLISLPECMVGMILKYKIKAKVHIGMANEVIKIYFYHLTILYLWRRDIGVLIQYSIMDFSRSGTLFSLSSTIGIYPSPPTLIYVLYFQFLLIFMMWQGPILLLTMPSLGS